jgi:hypothetical protein
MLSLINLEGPDQRRHGAVIALAANAVAGGHPVDHFELAAPAGSGELTGGQIVIEPDRLRLIAGRYSFGCGCPIGNTLAVLSGSPDEAGGVGLGLAFGVRL